MTRSHFVKKARRDYPEAGETLNIKKGDSYYWWKFRRGGKHFSRTAPKPSQLTQSDFYQKVYSLQEEHQSPPDSICEVETERDAMVEGLNNIKDEEEGKLDNMPEGLRDGNSGQIIQDRISALEDAISNLESADCSFEPPEPKGEDRIQEVWDELTGYLDISC
jgi:hypothetical protein